MSMKKRAFAVALIAALLAAAGGASAMGGRGERAVAPAVASSQASASSQTVDKDVPYVPTPRSVVEAMLRLAAPGPNDVHYDLGCGDGRIVIAAVQEFGVKRSVGVDIDPERIRESNANAAKAGVTDKVQFLQQDLFLTDFSDADVLTLYLLPSVNRKLRPKILSELKPGTRVVSHSFNMDDWKPDQSVREGSSSVYLWTVPANVSGDWNWTDSSGRRYGLRLDQKFQEATGTFVTDGGASEIRDVRVEGDRLRFTTVQKRDDKDVLLRFEGRASGDSLTGTVVTQDGAMDVAQWQASRDPSTMVALDGSYEPPTRSGSTAPSASPAPSRGARPL